MHTTSIQAQPIKSFELLSAITMGKATKHDLAAELNRLDLNISYSKLLEEKQTNINSSFVQRVPQVPFYLNGTFYEPKDIKHFNGQELHFVPSLSEDLMLVVDNIELINYWMILVNHELFGYQKKRQLPEIPTPGSVGNPGGVGEGDLAPAPGFGLSLPPYNVPYRTIFFTGTNYYGYKLELSDSFSYVPDLRRLFLSPSGFIFHGVHENWDKQISSFYHTGGVNCQLYEDYQFKGSTISFLSKFSRIPDLLRFGWDNRASSIRQWRNDFKPGWMGYDSGMIVG
ncbi:hypothetical protein CN995_07310 [Bacillus cereus]|uniref:hypothetical protein n=1 Tax=Bacillus TaxID=1386 RepID=UPI000BF38CCC|nr:hypothetical protein [Bacillus cereus]PEW55655.1 hypothetical protein CN443_22695 [Bacillus cereus]PFO90870.1 hypothetical protein COJ97_27855 [Bacillus cereus]PGP07495.1 hypothetical protein CN995_07310 [Bacillus cereus]PGY79438.1 hypothetical protein COE36_30780 [Bacillus cereus]